MVSDAVGPDWKPASWIGKYTILWQRINDVYQALCTSDLRRAYLEQAKAETDISYQSRVELATMDESLKKAIAANAGLLNEFEVSENSPDELQGEATSVTIENDNLKTYQGKVLHGAFKYGVVLCGCHIAPQSEDPDGRVPYFSVVSPDDLSSPLVQRRYDRQSGQYRNVLTRIAIRSYEDRPSDNGFSVQKVETYWVYRHGEDDVVTKERWERRKAETTQSQGKLAIMGPPEVITNAAGEPLGRLPFIWFSLDPAAKVGQPVIPPFMSLTDKLIRLFNMESELDAIQRAVNIPIPAQGWPNKIPNEPPEIPMSRDFVWHYVQGGDVKFVEPAGTGMMISDQRIQTLKNEIREEKEKYINISQTATAALLEAGQTQMTMQWFANAIESGFEELFKLWALLSDRSYNPEESAGGIRISLKFLKPSASPQELQLIPLLLETGGFKDTFEVRAYLEAINFWTKEMEMKAELKRENSNDDATPPMLMDRGDQLVLG